MHFLQHKILIGLGTALFTACAALPALADDSEVYLGTIADTSVVRPNILFVVDTSGSMGSTVFSKDPYSPAITYPTIGGCVAGRTFFRSGSGTPPTCGTNQWFNSAANRCNASALSLQLGAGGGPGTWTGKAAQWNSAPGARRWDNLRNAPGAVAFDVECETDAGNHGPNAPSALVWARDGDNAQLWTTDGTQKINWATRNVYSLYNHNWMNWFWGPGVSTGLNRLQTVQQVGQNLINSIDNVNLGIMRFDVFGSGGMVTHQMSNISTSRPSLNAMLNSFRPNGNTPLSETAFEATRYWLGGNVDFGLGSTGFGASGFFAQPSVVGSRNGPSAPNQYKSPIEYQCQRNFMILLTDGEPVGDTQAETAGRIFGLPDFNSLVGASCQLPNAPPSASGGNCLDDVVDYLFKQDLNQSASLPGRQNVTTYTIGFEIPALAAFLDATATKGGGRFFPVNDAADLTLALQNIVTDVLESNVTFTSPTISVNAFNRTQSLDDLYVSVFKPDDRLHWRGNLKKYKLDGGVIKDSAGNAAIDPSTGFFASGTQSFWSPTPDGSNADQGGAGSQLPAHASRNVYTHFAAVGSGLSAIGNWVNVANANLTDALLGTSASPTRVDVINWARGQDVRDEDGDLNTTESRLLMGDPIHSKPALVTYGGSTGSPDALDSVVFVPTNEGYLHAINTKTGAELWAFAPEEMLPRFVNLYLNPQSVAKNYGIDGDVRVLKFDINQDGIVDSSAGDKVYIYFGLRRGGRYYYGLDVTDRNSPQLLWKKTTTDLPGLGFAWSTPAVTRVKISGAVQNAQKFALIFGGGYDDVQENYSYTADTEGNRIFMLDAVSGNLLWYAGDSSSGADLKLAAMDNSIPGDITVIDFDGDLFADRMYAADMGGRVFRFDIHFDKPRGPDLVTGGVIATLGAGGVAGATIQDTRRFYNGPDVSLIRRRGQASFYNIAIGSGYRGHPLHIPTRDRFYSIRDRQAFVKLDQTQYNAITPLLDGDLIDVTDSITTVVPNNAPGWKLEMRLNGGWVGEKILAESVTVNNVILFPSFTPTPPSSGNPCAPSTGINRIYALSVLEGRPSVDFNDDGIVDERSQDLAQSGIAAELAILVDHDAPADPSATDPSAATPTVCISGVEVLRQCVSVGGVGRTYWRRDGAQ